MFRFKNFAVAGGVVLGLLAVSALIAPEVRAAVKAALTEMVAPSHPVYLNFSFTDNTDSWNATAGPGPNSTLAISSVTLSNWTSKTQDIQVFAPVFAGGHQCGDWGAHLVNGGGVPDMVYRVQSGETVHFSFPTPVVFPSAVGCVAVGANNTMQGGTVQVQVVGFYN